jgi:hypothetical protein
MRFSGFCLVFLALFSPPARCETISATPGFAPLPEHPEGWSSLPRSRPFGVLPSDPRDLRLGLRKNNKSQLEADVGGYRSLAGWRGDIAGSDTIFATGIEGAAYFTLRQDGSKFPLESSDGVIGLYAEAAREASAYQLRYTHISAHVADGLFGVRTPFVYTREFLSLRYAVTLAWLRPYAGYQFLTHTAPDLPRHTLELGGYGIAPAHWGAAHPYLGADLRIRNAQEGTTFQLGAGAAFVSERGAPPVRVTATYLKGHDLRGQFYSEKTEKWTFGLDLDI